MELINFFAKFNSNDACYAYLEQIIWANGRPCPKCGVFDESWKLTRSHYYECKCGHQFSVTANTLFYKTRLPLTKWFAAIFLLADSSKGISTNKVAKWLGLHYQTAWHMTQRIRAMMVDKSPHILSGIVELDETYVGGKPRFTIDPLTGKPFHHKTGRGTEKQPVFVAVERQGRVRSALIASHGIADIKPLVNDWVDLDSEIMTDELPAYKGIGKDYRFHHVVFHKVKEYARKGGIHSNTAESFNSTIKRAVMGVYHYISKKHMIRYVEEAVFRWNTRNTSNIDKFDLLLEQSVGRLLPFRYLIA